MRQKLICLPKKKKKKKTNHLICKIHEESRNFQIDIRAISEDVGQILCWFKLKERKEEREKKKCYIHDVISLSKNYLLSLILRVSNEWKYFYIKGR